MLNESKSEINFEQDWKNVNLCNCENVSIYNVQLVLDFQYFRHGQSINNSKRTVYKELQIGNIKIHVSSHISAIAFRSVILIDEDQRLQLEGKSEER